MLVMRIFDKNEKLVLTLTQDCKITSTNKRLKKAISKIIENDTMDALNFRTEGKNDEIKITFVDHYDRGTEEYIRIIYENIQKTIFNRRDKPPKAYVTLKRVEDD